MLATHQSLCHLCLKRTLLLTMEWRNVSHDCHIICKLYMTRCFKYIAVKPPLKCRTQIPTLCNSPSSKTTFHVSKRKPSLHVVTEKRVTASECLVCNDTSHPYFFKGATINNEKYLHMLWNYSLEKLPLSTTGNSYFQ
jgi:hypothetical protein